MEFQTHLIKLKNMRYARRLSKSHDLEGRGSHLGPSWNPKMAPQENSKNVLFATQNAI